MVLAPVLVPARLQAPVLAPARARALALVLARARAQVPVQPAGRRVMDKCPGRPAQRTMRHTHRYHTTPVGYNPQGGCTPPLRSGLVPALALWLAPGREP